MTDHTIIIGAGHNGLVCAAFLARAGRSVTVLEASDRVGGAAITREFASGFQVSACAHLLYGLDPDIASELDLTGQGLGLAQSELKTVSLSGDEDPLVFSGYSARGAGIDEQEHQALTDFRHRMNRFARLLHKLYRNPPPRLVGGTRFDLMSVLKLGIDLRMLGRDDMREFMRIAAINVYDVMQENFSNPAIQGALALDGVLGTHLGVRSNNSVFNLLHRWSATARGKHGTLALPKGGMGAVTGALADAARDAGAEIRTGCPVSAIRMDGDRVCGVELDDGERLDADRVVSNADPKTTFLSLVGAQNLEAGFAHKINNVRMRGNAAKLHLALDGLPRFAGVEDRDLGQRLVVAPDLDYVERAFDPAKYGRHSTDPVLEISIPSIHDDSLAPKGQHVLSAVVQYAPYHLKAGWDEARAGFQQRVMATLERYAPGISDQVVASELLTPVDIEREFRITGGHWHHGELALDQCLMMRPVPGAAQHLTPVNGLFLCGAGCHPGGGVMGNAGQNAAQVILSGGDDQ